MLSCAKSVMSPDSTTASRIWWSYWQRLIDCTIAFRYGLSFEANRNSAPPPPINHWNRYDRAVARRNRLQVWARHCAMKPLS